MSAMEIELVRAQIDQINREILGLLCRRGELVQELPPGRDPKRETQQLVMLHWLNQGPFPNLSITRIFQSIFDESLALKDESAARR